MMMSFRHSKDGASEAGYQIQLTVYCLKMAQDFDLKFSEQVNEILFLLVQLNPGFSNTHYPNTRCYPKYMVSPILIPSFSVCFFLDYSKMGNSKTWHYSNSYSEPMKLFAVIFHTYFSKSPMHGSLHWRPFVIIKKVRR